jgi:hypothetical protein
VVTTNTTQTITGEKTFDNNVYISQTSFINSTSLQLGYAQLHKTSGTTMGAAYTNLISHSIPKGVWVVEGQFDPTGCGGDYYEISLTESSTSKDISRNITKTINNGRYSHHMSSVFVLEYGVPIYFSINWQDGHGCDDWDAYLRYTRIG